MADLPPAPPRRPLLSPRAGLRLALAFGIGLLLFLLIWLDQRDDNAFYRPGAPGSVAPPGEPLPAPLPPDLAGAGDSASGLGAPRTDVPPAAPAAEAPQVVEPAPAPTPPPAAPAPPRATADLALPVPINTPPPRYPREALRRGIGGTVRVRVTVGPTGGVERLDLAQASGNRELDRAALETVRRWRFRPATRDGQPVSAEVVVPLEFDPRR